MRASIRNRATAIRHYLDRQDDLSADAATIYKYSVAAAQWEAVRLLVDKGKGTPADDTRFAELDRVLKALTKQVGLGDDVTAWKGFLPRDPQRLMCNTWQEAAEGW